jgi:hypothetical protein
MNSTPSPECVFICSAGHSGSTLLDMLIGSHPECESLGEVVLLPMEFAMDARCTCGVKIRGCPLWSTVAQKLAVDTEKNPYGLNLGYLSIKFGDARLQTPWAVARTRVGYGLSYYRQRYGIRLPRFLVAGFEEGIQNTLSLYHAVRTAAGKRVVVDSSKHHTRAAAIYRSQPDRVRIIFHVRDGRGVFYSGLKAGLDRRYSVDSWRKHYAHALPLLKRSVRPDHMLLLRYEDMANDPAGALSKVCDLADMPYDEAMLRFRSVIHHNVNGNQLRFGSGEKIRLDEGWRTGLSQQDAAYFERKAGHLNRLFGYQ